ncbi:MAG: hypothetical protein V3R94_06590 [Acidobacteriota bacterium]
MYRLRVVPAALLLFGLWGCSQGVEQSTAAEEEHPETSTEAESSPAPAAVLIVSSGTELKVRLAHSVSSATNQPGDAFEAILDQDLLVDDQVVAPEGSALTGRLTDVVSSGKVKGRARMTLVLETLQVGDASYPIQVAPISFEAETTVKEDAVKVGIGAGIGAVVGAIAGGKKGAAVGTAIGGGGGAAAVMLTKGAQVEFEAEQDFQFQLVQDLEIQ